MALKSNWKRKYKSDVLIAIAIAFLPFLGFVHLLFSTDIETFSIFGIEYSHIFHSNRGFVWDLFRSIIALSLLLIWFYTISMSYRYLILPLFILYVYDILQTLFLPYGSYPFYPFFFEKYPITLNILIITSIMGIIIYWDLHFFKSYRKRVLEISIKSIFNQNMRNSNNFYRENLEYLNVNKEKITWTKYLQKIFNTKLVLENRLKMFGSSKNNSARPQGNHLNLFIISILIFSTFLWFVHYFVPENEQSLDLGIIQVYKNGFMNVRAYIWVLMQKLIVLIPITLWFLSCQHWWKYAILSPIILYSYQFWESMQDVPNIDAAGNIRAFPAIFFVVLILLALSKTIKYRVEILTMYEHLLGEIDDLMNNPDFIANNRPYKKFRRFTELKEEIAREANTKKQLMRLILLREELLKHLQTNY